MITTMLKLYQVVRPSGRRRLFGALALVAFQALMQTVAVFSLVPFLSAAADIERFRVSFVGRIFVDALGGGSNKAVLLAAGLTSLVLLVSGNIIALIAEYARSRYAQSVGLYLRSQILRALLERNYDYFLNINSSVLVKNLIEDISSVSLSILMPAMEVISRIALVLMLVSTLIFVEPWVILGAIIIVTLYYILVMRPIRITATRSSGLINNGVKNIYFEVQQTLGGIKPILANGHTEYFVNRVERTSADLSREVARLPMYSSIPRSGLEILVFGGMIGWLILLLLTGNELSNLIPRISLIAIIAYRVMPSLQTIFANFGAISASQQSLDEVAELLSQRPAQCSDAEKVGARHLDPLRWEHEIRFENVTFQYSGADVPALANVSFTIPKGSRVAFVGHTGSGKSTLIDLLLGLLEPTSGHILVDGQPLTSTELSRWRSTVGYVPQELFLLDGTIAENIAFGFSNSDLDRQRVADVARMAQATEFIEDGRSQGFEALVGERGVRLSGGQRQRLALARALYGRPSILVMDEATSALDPQTEHKVVTALKESFDRVTVVTVTHRMTTVKDYDCIYFLQAGRIAGSGDYATLLETHSSFRIFVN